jgi:KDO2-lipid IV(A) lauroyltransferase
MYYILYGFLYLVSLLPLPVMYVISDITAFLLFRVIGYRRKIIEQNIHIAFPSKTEEERKKIARKFHRNFTDNFIETLKCISASRSFFEKHCTGDMSIFEELNREGISCQFHGGHQFNWEWINLHMAIHVKQPTVIVYMPISSKPLDKLFFNMRARFGTELLPATNMRFGLVKWRKKVHVLTLIADQTPAAAASGYWLNFFGRPTPFIKGPEKNAMIKKEAVVFGRMAKKGRGRYQSEFKLVCKDTSTLQQGELTRLYRDYLEMAITEEPDIYLWSHRRWKFNYTPEFEKEWIDTTPPPVQ